MQNSTGKLRSYYVVIVAYANTVYWRTWQKFVSTDKF